MKSASAGEIMASRLDRSPLLFDGKNPPTRRRPSTEIERERKTSDTVGPGKKLTKLGMFLIPLCNLSNNEKKNSEAA